MGLQEQLSEDVKTAMRARDMATLGTLRMLRAQIKDVQIAKQRELDDNEVIEVLLNAAKKRKEAIELYEKGGRQDLLEKEQAEYDLIAQYLPKQLSEIEVDEIVTGIIAETGATSEQDFGKVMGAAMRQLKGKADGKVIQNMVRAKLS